MDVLATTWLKWGIRLQRNGGCNGSAGGPSQHLLLRVVARGSAKTMRRTAAFDFEAAAAAGTTVRGAVVTIALKVCSMAFMAVVEEQRQGDCMCEVSADDWGVTLPFLHLGSRVCDVNLHHLGLVF